MSYYDIFTNAMFNGAGLVLGIIIGLYIFSILNGFLTGLLSVFTKKKKVNNDVVKNKQSEIEFKELMDIFKNEFQKNLNETKKENENDKTDGSNN